MRTTSVGTTHFRKLPTRNLSITNRPFSVDFDFDFAHPVAILSPPFAPEEVYAHLPTPLQGWFLALVTDAFWGTGGLGRKWA